MKKHSSSRHVDQHTPSEHREDDGLLEAADSIEMILANSLTMPLLELIETAQCINDDIEILVARGDVAKASLALPLICDLVLTIAATEPQSVEEAITKVGYVCLHRKAYGPQICKTTEMLDAVLDRDCERWGIWIADRDWYGETPLH